jgi:16S rRNA processing protein RimM
MSAPWDEMAAVGRIARAHGIRGQVIVSLQTDFPEERFQPGAELFIERNGTVQALTLTSVRFHRDRPVVGIAGIDTMNDAEALAGHELRVPVDRLARLPDGGGSSSTRPMGCST